MYPPRVLFGPNPTYIVEPAHRLTKHFDAFFQNINPAQTWRDIASSQYNSIKQLLETDSYLSSQLGIQCKTQGSYDRHTSIHSINDLDIVAFCTRLHYPAQLTINSNPGDGWTRDRIFAALEAVLANSRYREVLIKSTPSSMCVKLDLGIKVEILPVVPQYGIFCSTSEPFYLWRPSRYCWELGYAEMHQSKLSEKNAPAFRFGYFDQDSTTYGTGGNFIPAVKILKHLCSIYDCNIVSFHLECLLYSLPNDVFSGSPAAYIQKILSFLSTQEPLKFYRQGLKTPCGDREIFSSDEWDFTKWLQFYGWCTVWKDIAVQAHTAYLEGTAIDTWRNLLSPGWFPRNP